MAMNFTLRLAGGRSNASSSSDTGSGLRNWRYRQSSLISSLSVSHLFSEIAALSPNPSKGGLHIAACTRLRNSPAVQQLNDWTVQMRGRINRAMEIRYADQIRHAESLGQEEAARFRINDGDLQIDVSQPKEIVWDQQHLSQIAERMVVAGDRVQDFRQVQFSVAEQDYARWHPLLRAAFQPARKELITEPTFQIRWVGDVQL